MKNTAYILAIAMFLAVSCQKNESPEDSVYGNKEHYKTLAVGVEEDQQTRVGFDENNLFYWQKGDRIGVLTASGLK